MTKVVITSPVWSLNGVNVFSADLAEGLREKGYDVRLLLTGVTYRERKPLPKPQAVSLEQLAIPRRATWSARRRALREYLERNAPCVYLPNHDFNHSCIASSLSARVGVIGIIHSDDDQHYDHFRRLGETWNAVVAVSSRIRETLEGLRKVDTARLHTVPYGVRQGARRSAPNDRPLRIIYTGRLEEKQKRVGDLVRIAQRLIETGIAFQMSIVGDGPERDKLGNAVADTGLSSSVKLIGTVDSSRVRELCAGHDVFLLPSLYEGMPISLLEAMGQGCIPVVRESLSGIPELITHGENGMIVRDGDIDDYCNCIRRIASDSRRRREMSEKAQTTISAGGFSLNTMIDRYCHLIDEVAAESRSGKFVRRQSQDACPRMSLRDVIAAPLWSLRPSLRAQQATN